MRGERPGGDGDDVVMKGDSDNEVRGGDAVIQRISTGMGCTKER